MSDANHTLLRYMQVYLALKSQIQSGKYPPGSRIPTEKKLLEYYQVSITTLRRSIEMLCKEGFLSKKQGSGTFVNFVSSPEEKTENPEQPAQVKIAVVIPDASRMTLEGDWRHWQLNLRRMAGIYQEASQRGAGVSLFDLSEDFDLSEFDGAIIFRSFELEEEELFNRLTEPLRELGRPCVVVSEYDLRYCAQYWVVENLELEFLLAYRYLQNKGARKVLLLGSGLTNDNPRFRALSRLERPLECELLENPRSDRESAREKVKAYLESHHGLGGADTMFCLTDLQALGAMEAILAYGLRIPEDVNLMGCDNLTDGANAPVPLTTFQFSGKDVGRAALELAVRAIRGDFPDGMLFCQRSRIIERQSVRDRH